MPDQYVPPGWSHDDGRRDRGPRAAAYRGAAPDPWEYDGSGERDPHAGYRRQNHVERGRDAYEWFGHDREDQRREHYQQPHRHDGYRPQRQPAADREDPPHRAPQWIGPEGMGHLGPALPGRDGFAVDHPDTPRDRADRPGTGRRDWAGFPDLDDEDDEPGHGRRRALIALVVAAVAAGGTALALSPPGQALIDRLTLLT